MLNSLFGSSLRATAIGWLLTHSNERFFLRELAGILEVDPGNLSKELVKLHGMGILLRLESGNQVYYQANIACPIYGELHGIAVKTIGIGDVLRDAITSVADNIKIAFIFGSFAESKEHAGSDIDLMIIGDSSLAEITPLLDEAEDRLKREINLHIFTQNEFSEKQAAGHHFISHITSTDKIFIIGDSNVFAEIAGGQLDKRPSDLPSGN